MDFVRIGVCASCVWWRTGVAYRQVCIANKKATRQCQRACSLFKADGETSVWSSVCLVGRILADKCWFPFAQGGIRHGRRFNKDFYTDNQFLCHATATPFGWLYTPKLRFVFCAVMTTPVGYTVAKILPTGRELSLIHTAIILYHIPTAAVTPKNPLNAKNFGFF